MQLTRRCGVYVDKTVISVVRNKERRCTDAAQAATAATTAAAVEALSYRIRQSSVVDARRR